MSKPFKTVDEQINILKSRGLTILNEDKAKRHLLLYNYYNVINCFSKYLYISQDTYISNANFDEIAHIHYYDEEVKSVLFKYIIEIEKHLKSIISYVFSKNHKGQPYPYLYNSNFRNDNLLENTNIIAYMAKLIKDNSKPKLPPNAIKHYQNQHNDVPLWVLINLTTFGKTIQFYQCMKDSEQNEVAKEFSILLNENVKPTIPIKFTSKDLLTVIENVCEIRNIIAHNNRLIDLKCKYHIKYIPQLHSKYGILPNDSRQDVYNTFIAMQALLTSNQYAQLHNTLLSRTKKLNRELKSISPNDVIKSYGFPIDWHMSAKLPQ